MAESFGLMGILNLTPDSFYAKSRCGHIDAAVSRAGMLLAAGADIIDLGAESTRPGAQSIPWQEECRRLLPALAAIREAHPNAAISIDTHNSATAAAALASGAAIINDVSACGHDPELMAVLAEFKPAYVLTHSGFYPQNMEHASLPLIEEMKIFFSTRLERLMKAGLSKESIILDPGIGFGKTAAANLQILANISRFLDLGRPLLIGISMKSFFASIWNLDLPLRKDATATLSALLYEKGCLWHRAHDIQSVKTALLIAQSLSKAATH